MSRLGVCDSTSENTATCNRGPKSYSSKYGRFAQLLNTAILPRTFLAHVVLPPFEHCNSPPQISSTRFLPPFEDCNSPRKFLARVFLPPFEHCNSPRKFLAHVFLPPFEHCNSPRKFLAHVFLPPFATF